MTDHPVRLWTVPIADRVMVRLPSGDIGLERVTDPDCPPGTAYLLDPAQMWPTPRWRPSPADHHDRGENCGEIECERCASDFPTPDDLA